MTAYRRILAAIDLTQDSQAVAGRACEIARADNASVQLLQLGLPENAGSVEAGSAKGEILRYAREHNAVLAVRVR